MQAMSSDRYLKQATRAAQDVPDELAEKLTALQAEIEDRFRRMTGTTKPRTPWWVYLIAVLPVAYVLARLVRIWRGVPVFDCPDDALPDWAREQPVDRPRRVDSE